MRAIGIVRRIDDLGRVVIPKEIRKRLGIQEGAPLELYVDEGTKSIVLTPYKTDTVQNVRNLAYQVEKFAEDYGDWSLGTDLRNTMLDVSKKLEELESSY